MAESSRPVWNTNQVHELRPCTLTLDLTLSVGFVLHLLFICIVPSCHNAMGGGYWEIMNWEEICGNLVEAKVFLSTWGQLSQRHANYVP